MAGALFPELGEVENFVILIFFADIGVAIAKDLGGCILSHKGENPLLAPAPLGDIMLFNECVFPVEGDGVEVQIKGRAPFKAQSPHGVKPKAHQSWVGLGIHPAAIFGEEGAFGDRVQTGKKGQPLVEHIAHDMAVAGRAKEFESQKGANGASGRDHHGSGKSRLRDQVVKRDGSQKGNKKKEAAEFGVNRSGAEIKLSYIGPDRGDGFYPGQSFFVSSSWKPGEAVVFQDVGYTDRAELMTSGFKDLGNVINGEVFLSKRDHLFSDLVLFGGFLGPLPWWNEERAMGVFSEVMGQDPETSFRIPEAPGSLLVAYALDEIGAEGFVLPVGGVLRLEEEASHIC
jgi:hypothetical protein